MYNITITVNERNDGYILQYPNPRGVIEDIATYGGCNFLVSFDCREVFYRYLSLMYLMADSIGVSINNLLININIEDKKIFIYNDFIKFINKEYKVELEKSGRYSFLIYSEGRISPSLVSFLMYLMKNICRKGIKSIDELVREILNDDRDSSFVSFYTALYSFLLKNELVPRLFTETEVLANGCATMAKLIIYRNYLDKQVKDFINYYQIRKIVRFRKYPDLLFLDLESEDKNV